jgi:hypothetical protein
MDKQQLRQDLLTVFNEQEMAAFCARLGFSYAQLGGSAAADRVSSLIGRMERNGRLPQMVAEMVRERPHLEPMYHTYLNSQNASTQDKLGWLDRLAAGEGRIIEEPPTMSWDSQINPRLADDEPL